MTDTLRCRWNQQLGGYTADGACDAPVMSTEDLEALELSGFWCKEHGTRLAALSLGTKIRKTNPVDSPTVKPPPLTVGELKERYDQKRATEAQRRTSELADDFVMYVKNSRTFPVKRREVVDALGVSANAFQRAANLAISRGDIVSVRWAGPKLSGYFTPETAPADHPNLKAAA
jgi:hypothetical protein